MSTVSIRARQEPDRVRPLVIGHIKTTTMTSRCNINSNKSLVWIRPDTVRRGGWLLLRHRVHRPPRVIINPVRLHPFRLKPWPVSILDSIKAVGFARFSYVLTFDVVILFWNSFFHSVCDISCFSPAFLLLFASLFSLFLFFPFRFDVDTSDGRVCVPNATHEAARNPSTFGHVRLSRHSTRMD